ncbi:MAG: hypothetical protein Q4P65_04295, partial [Eubacteriales bacterium]|nr:hypothetical protein [Eubacteriales bacterium]
MLGRFNCKRFLLFLLSLLLTLSAVLLPQDSEVFASYYINYGEYGEIDFGDGNTYYWTYQGEGPGVGTFTVDPASNGLAHNEPLYSGSLSLDTARELFSQVDIYDVVFAGEEQVEPEPTEAQVENVIVVFHHVYLDSNGVWQYAANDTYFEMLKDEYSNLGLYYLKIEGFKPAIIDIYSIQFTPTDGEQDSYGNYHFNLEYEKLPE